jgi:hypothetical protein
MSKSRRTVLSGVVTPLRPEPAAREPVAAAVADLPAGPAMGATIPMRRRSATKEATIQQTVYLAPAVHDQLRELAFAERIKMHALIMEGLDEVFRKRGLKPMDMLARKS